jgi:hypothetical protein
MFQYKRNPDVGRKFESGASKRTRKVELEKKNKEVNGSLLNFLTRDEATCLKNKCFSDNERCIFSGIKQPTSVRNI